MSTEEFWKVQTCVLKVNIHCDGCKLEVRKILQKIDGVYKTHVDSDLGKVTVSGNVDPNTLMKKLSKNGKHAELWGAPKANNQKNMQIDNGRGRSHNGQKAGGGGGQNHQQQLERMKAFEQKAVKFNLPEDDDLTSADEFDDDSDDDDEDSDDDAPHHHHHHHHPPLNKMKPQPMMMGNGQQMPNMMMMNGQQHPQLTNAQANGAGGGGGQGGGSGNGGNGKKGGGGGSGKNGAGHQSHGKNGGGAQNKNGNNNGDAGKKRGGACGGVQGMPNGGGGGGQGKANGCHAMGGANVGHMGGQWHMPIGQMGQMPAVQGLHALTMNAAGGGGYFNGVARPEMTAGNQQNYQQQMAAMMMNQQRANGNEMFQPMLYSWPPPAINYMPLYPYPYQYPPPADPYTHAFSDENTSSCSIL